MSKSSAKSVIYGNVKQE